MLRSIKNSILACLAYPETQEICLDSPEASLKHWRIIREKPFLYKIYHEWYQSIAAALPQSDKPALEIGSGGGFMRDYVKGLICSDIMPLPHNDMAMDACTRFPFDDESLRAITMVNTFHHLPDAESFLTEASRCLTPGGAIVMVEPWVTTWSKVIYSKLHHEPFEPNTNTWQFESSGPLSSANGALPWIVFARDKEAMEQRFPELSVERVEVTMPLRYLLSGGVSMRALVPNWSFGLWTGFENLLRPLLPQLGMFALIKVKKKSKQAAKRKAYSDLIGAQSVN